ncbi:aldo/keto reductase [candidate division KSB1 bacterium]|jgi:aryl-alcohol dehydrogenase-like predicted oxidoreductase|nr:aldo/keto reductase [candidate division KSB1 bacterium]
METRSLGKYGPALSILGLGTWSMAGSWRYGWGHVEEKQALATLHRALDRGINWIDTAPVYGLGRAESLVAKAVNVRPEKIFVASKCGIWWNSKGKLRHDLAPAMIHREIDATLERLQMKRLDLYQIHWPDPRFPIEKSWRVLKKLLEKGVVLRIGLSNVSLEQLEKCQSIYPVHSLQPPYNLLRREAQETLFPFCRNHGIGVLAYSPLFSGLLSESFQPEIQSEDDWRRRDQAFQEPALGVYRQFVGKLKEIADSCHSSVINLALSWVTSHPEVTSAIVGARQPEHIDRILDTPYPDMTPRLKKQLLNLAANVETNIGKYKPPSH